MRHASVPLDAALGNDGKEEGTVPQQRVSCVRDCSTKRELIRSPSRGRRQPASFKLDRCNYFHYRSVGRYAVPSARRRRPPHHHDRRPAMVSVVYRLN